MKTIKIMAVLLLLPISSYAGNYFCEIEIDHQESTEAVKSVNVRVVDSIYGKDFQQALSTCGQHVYSSFIDLGMDDLIDAESNVDCNINVKGWNYKQKIYWFSFKPRQEENISNTLVGCWDYLEKISEKGFLHSYRSKPSYFKKSRGSHNPKRRTMVQVDEVDFSAEIIDPTNSETYVLTVSVEQEQ